MKHLVQNLYVFFENRQSGFVSSLFPFIFCPHLFLAYLTVYSAWTGPPIGYLVGIGYHNGDCMSQIIQAYPAIFVCCPGVSDRRSVHFQNNKIRELKLTVTAAAECLTSEDKNLTLTMLFFIKLANIWTAAAVAGADMPTRTASKVNFTFGTSSCRLSVKVSQMVCLCFFACTFLFFAVRCHVHVNSTSVCIFHPGEAMTCAPCRLNCASSRGSMPLGCNVECVCGCARARACTIPSVPV